MALGPSGRWERPQFTGCAGRILPACEHTFALDLKQAGFDRDGTTKPPQQACQSMTKRKLDHGSRHASSNRLSPWTRKRGSAMILIVLKRRHEPSFTDEH